MKLEVNFHKLAGLLLLFWVSAGLPMLTPDWARAQSIVGSISYDSTSTGMEDYNPTCDADSGSSKVVDVGSTGIREFNSITIHEACTISFTPRGTGSKPVVLLVKQDVLINGTVDVNGSNGGSYSGSVGGIGGTGGPGGDDGGRGGTAGAAIPLIYGERGHGVNGGAQNCSGGSLPIARTDAYTQPLVGGGGGGGYQGNSGSQGGGSGGGGGGALWIAASGTITVSATGGIYSLGGTGGAGSGCGGAGAKGMVHLTATDILGSGAINAGYIILESPYASGVLDTFTLTGTQHRISLREMAWSLPVPSDSISITHINDTAIDANSGTIALSAEGAITVKVQGSAGLTSGQATGLPVYVYLQGRTSNKITIYLDFYGYAEGSITVPAGFYEVHANLPNPP